MESNKRVLVAGATGYLGKYVVKELKRKGYWVRALCRSNVKAEFLKQYADEIFIGEATEPETLKGICSEIDIVFSSLGITRQKDGLNYRDVDYQANKNILEEALREKVTQFMYVSVFNANKLKNLKIVEAKERFVTELIKSGINYKIIRPNGFFSDMTEFFNMAKKGRIYLFGKGEYRGNPIHGEDLAKACVEHFNSEELEIAVGGPEILTQNEIVSLAFNALNKEEKTTYFPAWTSTLIIRIARLLTSTKIYGPIEFFLTVLTMDMIAPAYGQHTLKKYFGYLNEVNNA